MKQIDEWMIEEKMMLVLIMLQLDLLLELNKKRENWIWKKQTTKEDFKRTRFDEWWWKWICT